MLTEFASHPWCQGAATLVLAYALYRFLSILASAGTGFALPPMAQGHVPLLGHALAYKKDPSGFLLAQHDAVGGAFTLNLAGAHMVVLTDLASLRQWASAPVAVLSSEAALVRFGFEETLGLLNLKHGGHLHKLVLKSSVYPELANKPWVLAKHMEEAVAVEVAGEEGVFDAIPALRRIMLRATISWLLGGEVISTYPGLLSDYIDFQDALEEATAAAVALPGYIAKLVATGPVARKRATIVERLAGCIQKLWEEPGSAGLWATRVGALGRGGHPGAELPKGWDEYVAGAGGLSPHQGAELVVGLLFAAHKNPGIGAAQALLHLLEHPLYKEAVQEEVDRALDSPGAGAGEGWSGLREHFIAAPTRQWEEGRHSEACILETLRISAHTIGGVRRVVAPGGFKFTTAGGKTYTVPPGYNVGASHLVPNTTGDSGGRVYDPSKFLEGGRGAREYPAWATFSSGVHKCPGEKLALVMIKLALWALLARLDVQPLGDAGIPPLDFSRATLAQRRGWCGIRYKTRLQLVDGRTVRRGERRGAR